MKKFVSKSVILTMLIAFFGCSSDSSSDSNSCTPITCYNSGISNPSCGCDCPEGYSGADCSKQLTPSKITITKIRVKYFPNTDAGSSWDISLPTANNSFPDIFLTLENSSLTEIYQSTTYYKNVISDGSLYYDFVPETPISITSLSSGYILNLLDYDGADSNLNDGVDDNMGFIAFNLYSSTGGFPNTISVLDTSKSLGFELSLAYTW